jgi:hypothetical protein
VQAVSLDVPLQVVLSDPASLQALMQWVRGGGTVLLHTDAAQLFGYRTVAPRQATNAVAGQGFGRARAALPFAANPLLWSMRGAPNTPGASGLAPAGTTAPANAAGVRASAPLTTVPGVRLVYYQMAPYDQLAYAHPAGVPLLRVADVTGSSSTSPLYAAALASYGRGWAFFVPSLVEQHRADGAAFVQGLLRLIAVSPGGTGAAPVPTSALTAGADVWISFPADLITGASDAAASGNFNPATLLGPFALAVFGGDVDEPQSAPFSPDADDETDPSKRRRQTSRQFSGHRTLHCGPDSDAARSRCHGALAQSRPQRQRVARRAITALYLLRLRLELQRENLDAAASWLTAAQRVAGAAAETLLWRGALAADDAEELSNTAPARATRWRYAARVGRRLSMRLRCSRRGCSRHVITSAACRALRAGVDTGAVAAANRAAAEPPLVQVVSAGASDITVRHNGNQQIQRYFGPPLQRLDAISRVFRLAWRRRRVRIFPDVDTYANYRNVAGLRPQDFVARLRPNQYYTDEFGNRVLGFPPNRNTDDEEPLTPPSGSLGDVVNGRALTLMPLSDVPQRYLAGSRTRTRVLLSPGFPGADWRSSRTCLN